MGPSKWALNIIHDVETLPESKTVPMRKVREAYSIKLREEPAEFVLAVAKAILSKGKHRWIAYELIRYHPDAYRSLNRTLLETLGKGMDNWWSVDSFARTLSGPAWRDGLLNDEAILPWAQSSDRWWRRAALVSTVALNIRSRGGQGDVPRTLRICKFLAGDKDDMVVKAVSWALRELVVHDQGAVMDFLKEYDHVLAARVKREVMNKLRTGLKNP